MKRVSKNYVVILEPNRNNPLMFLFSMISKEERRVLRYSPIFLKDILCKVGLKIIYSFSYGLIVPNRSPELLLPFFKLFNFKFFFGMTNFIIARK